METLTAEPKQADAKASTTQAPPAAAAAPAAAPTAGTQLGGQQAPKAAEQAKAGEAQPAKRNAPEQYAFKPLDEEHPLDAEVLKAYGEVARELDLSQESAQKVIDKLAPVMQTRAEQALTTARAEWLETARSDKEIGGEKFDENVKVALKAVARFGTPELRELFNVSGAGDHPELIRLFYRIGKAISEDRFVGPNSSSTAGKDIAHLSEDEMARKLYPTMRS